MRNQQAGFSPAVCISQAVDHIIQAGFEDLQQVQTGQTAPLERYFIITMELAFQNTIHPASFLLGAQLAGDSPIRVCGGIERLCHACQADNHAVQKRTSERSSVHLSGTAFHLRAGIIYILAHDTLP